MRIARGKNGRLGRVVKTMGDSVVVSDPTPVYASNVAVNQNNLDYSESYWQQMDDALNQKIAQAKAQADKKAQAQAQKDAANAQYIQDTQNAAAQDPTQALLAAYFLKQKMTPESVRTAQQVSADFSETEILPGNYHQSMSPRSGDFQIFDIVGNPLTRDGAYGVVTDYDLYMRGQELSNDYVDGVGATIARQVMTRDGLVSLDAQPRKRSSMGSRAQGRVSHSRKNARARQSMLAGPRMGLGDDSSDSSWWDSFSNWAGDLYDNTTDQLSSQLPSTISQQLINQVNPPKTTTTTTSGGTTYVVTSSNPAQQMATSLGIPVSMVYMFAGLMGFGVLMSLIRAMK